MLRPAGRCPNWPGHGGVPQSLVNVEVRSKPALDSVPEVVEAVEQVESELDDQGRVLVRYSGTQACAGSWSKAPRAHSRRCTRAALADVVKAALG